MMFPPCISRKPGLKLVRGFAALKGIPDATTETPEKHLASKIESGSPYFVRWSTSLRRLKRKAFKHTATPILKQDKPAHTSFLRVHITLSDPKGFVLGTHYKVEAKYLPNHFAEFNYKLNHRTMKSNLITRVFRA
jgi:hypothetical protein